VLDSTDVPVFFPLCTAAATAGNLRHLNFK
jgi:hypothetical protein